VAVAGGKRNKQGTPQAGRGTPIAFAQTPVHVDVGEQRTHDAHVVAAAEVLA